MMNKKTICTVLFVLLLVWALLLSSCGEALPGDEITTDDGKSKQEQSASGAPSSLSGDPSPLISMPSKTSVEQTASSQEELTPQQMAYRELCTFVEQNGGACGGSSKMTNGMEPSFVRALSKSYEYNGGATRTVYIGMMQGELCLFYDASGFQVRVLFGESGASASVICHASTYRCTETLTCGKKMDPLYFNGSTEHFNGGPFSDYEPRYNMLTLLDRCDAILKEQGLSLTLKDLGYEHQNAELFALQYMYG